MSADTEEIAGALGLLLQRGVRAQLHGSVVEGVHPAVTTVNYPIVSAIARWGPISASALSEEIGLERSFISRRAADLIQAGLLATASDPFDARVTLLALTAEGSAVVGLLRERLNRLLTARLADWTAADQRRLAHLLGRFSEALTTPI